MPLFPWITKPYLQNHILIVYWILNNLNNKLSDFKIKEFYCKKGPIIIGYANLKFYPNAYHNIIILGRIVRKQPKNTSERHFYANEFGWN